MDEQYPVAVSRSGRFGLIAVGVFSLLAALPVGFLALVAVGSSHDTRLDFIDYVLILSLLAFPVLLLLFGLTSLMCSTRKALRLVAAAALLIFADLLAFFIASDIQSRPPIIYPVIPPPSGKVTVIGSGQAISLPIPPPQPEAEPQNEQQPDGKQEAGGR